MRKIATVTVLAGLAVVAAGCSTTTTTVGTAPAHNLGTSTTASPTSSPASPSPQSKAGQVGQKLTVTSHDGEYEVTLLSVDQQARPDSEYSSVEPGHHLAAAQFRVTAITSTDENANNNATVTGSDDQAYESSSEGVAAGTNFASGTIRLQPGNSLVGWVSFELPNGVQVARVQWTPSSGFSTDTAEWLVSGSAATSPGGTATAGTTIPTAASSPTATSSPTTTSSGGAAPGGAVSPEDTVYAYFDAINDHDYREAWNLGGKNTTSTYSSFVRGFATTAMVSVQVLDISGDPAAGVVTARLTTLETDGSTKVFEGTYTVRNGVIDEFSVRQVS